MKKLLSLLLAFGSLAHADLSPLSVSATAIQGFTISATAPSNNDCLKYSTGTSSWFPSPCGGGGGSGTVTSVALTAPAFLTVTGSPVTTSGTLALSFSGIAIPILNGGTGATTATAAFNNLAPSQTSKADSVLRTDGTNTSWAGLFANPLNDLWANFINLKNQGELRLNDSTSAFYTSFRAPTTLAANLPYLLPNAYPVFNGEVLSSDITGNLSWQIPSVTDPLLLNNGSAASPTYAFSSSSGLGMYRAGGSTLGFSVAGSLHTFYNTSGMFPGADNAYIWGAPSDAPTAIYSHQFANLANGLTLWYDDTTTHFFALQAQDSFTADTTMRVPNGIGSSGQAWTTDGAGNSSWTYGPQGTICGWYNVVGAALVSSCRGSDPSVSCPTGYTQKTTTTVDFCVVN